MILQAGRILGDAMRKLVADDVERTCEVDKDFAVAVAEHHLLPVPEGILEAGSAVDVTIQPQTFAIDRVASEHGTVEVAHRAEPVEGTVDGGIVAGRGIFRSGKYRLGQIGAVLAIVDRSPAVGGLVDGDPTNDRTDRSPCNRADVSSVWSPARRRPGSLHSSNRLNSYGGITRCMHPFTRTINLPPCSVTKSCFGHLW